MAALQNIQSAYFLGIGGIGMSSIARYFASRGIKVAGYDKTPSPLTKQLEKEGMLIHYHDRPDWIPADIDIVIYTPAIPESLNEFVLLKRQGAPIYKRSQVLGMISENHFTVAVAGTHGKTSVSSLIAHILHWSGQHVTAFVGGIMKNYRSNCIISDSTEIVVVEADEFDRSFLHLHPDIIVITAIDPDHLDIYGNGDEMERNFKTFASQIRPGGQLIIESKLQSKFQDKPSFLTYGLAPSANFTSVNAFIDSGFQVFDLQHESLSINRVKFALPGEYNRKNVAAAFAVASHMGTEPDKIKQAIESYQGVERRFDIRIRNNNIVFIDDYAHHPEELKACIEAVRTLFPDKTITGVFQPHLFSRTRDFADGFAASLDKLDKCILIPIYPAREKPIEGVSSVMIYDRMRMKSKYHYQKNELVEKLMNFDLEVLLTLGAGDIDRLVIPIKNMLEEKYG